LNKLKLVLIILLVFLFNSCDDDSQITGEVIEPDQPEYTDIDLNGFGCSGDYLCAHLGDLYYNFLSDDSYSQEFYKFNAYHLSGGAHNQTTDILNFNSYNSIYYIPSSSIFNEDQNTVYDGDYVENNNNNIVSLNLENTTSHDLSSELVLTSTSFSILDSIIWNSSANRYNFRTITAPKDTTIYPYSHSYDSIFYSTLVDTVLTNIYGDMVLIDWEEEVYRNYIDYDTLVIEDEGVASAIKIKRGEVFYIKDYFVKNNSLMFQERTDCNDNYQQDAAEYKISDFESDCLGDWMLDESNPCNSYCSTEPDKSLDDLCWEAYENNDRLTGRCNADAYVEAFCDTGNSLWDGEEYYYDIDGSGTWNLIGQDFEPWDDRNCNGILDQSNEEIINSQDEASCLSEDFTTWNDGVCFYDSGNSEFDDQESCYTGGSEGCDYKELYKRADSPNIFMVDYSDVNNPSPILVSYPADDFADCGNDGLCNKNEEGYDAGTCADGYSGNEEDCCKNNLCWSYTNNACAYDLDSCDYLEINLWDQNLDPEGDDFVCDSYNDDNGNGFQDYNENCTEHNNGTEGNYVYDSGEALTKDFNNDGLWDDATSLTNKLLDYDNCNSNCGAELMYIVEDSLRQIPASSSADKISSLVSVQSYNIIDQIESDSVIDNPADFLGNYNIVKTDFVNSSGYQDYDYMLFLESENQDNDGMHYIIKLIHPYYYFAPGYYIPQDIYEFSEDDFWQSMHLENDTMMYSLEGQVIEGQTYYSSYSIETDTANYNIHKEYVVGRGTALREYDSPVADCFIITRMITTTMVGSGNEFKLLSQTYLKPDSGYPLVKEDIYVYWTTAPWEGDTWYPISSIEFKEDSGSMFTSNNIFNSRSDINLTNLENKSDFDFKPFRMTNTIGLQRIEFPY